MAVRYNSQSKFGELDVTDIEGRGHVSRFGGPGTGQNVKTDIVLAGDPACPNQLTVITPNAPQGQITTTAESVTFSNNAIDVVLYTRLGDSLNQSELQMDIGLKTRAAANAAASFNMNFSGHEFFNFDYITPIVPVYEEIKRGQPWVYNYDRAAYIASNDKPNFPIPPGGFIGRQKWHNGGYVVKHKTWKNLRQNSIYCIISIPKLTDALGNESWGSLSFNPATGAMTYINNTIFLGSAPLPITLDPTFGDTTVGADTFPMSNDRILVGVFTAPEAGTVDSIHFYSGNGTQNQKGVVFATSASVPTGDPVVVGGVVANASTPAWRTSTAASEAITAVDYGIGAVAESGAADEWYKDTSGGNDSHLDNGNSYATPNSWAETSAYGGQMNAYITYTASGGGGSPISITGSGVLSATGQSSASGAQSIAATATATFNGSSRVSSPVSLSATGLATFTGAAAAASPVAITSTATAEFVGASTNLASGALSITSSAILSLIGQSSASGAASIASASTMTMVGAAVHAAIWGAAATSLLDMVGTSTAAGSGAFNIASTASLQMVGEAAASAALAIEPAALTLWVSTSEVAEEEGPTPDYSIAAGVYGWNGKINKKRQKELTRKQNEEFMKMCQAALPLLVAAYIESTTITYH